MIHNFDYDHQPLLLLWIYFASVSEEVWELAHEEEVLLNRVLQKEHKSRSSLRQRAKDTLLVITWAQWGDA